ncbi:MAG TPA: hypothetical protein DDW52_14535 [Planctomycetaceae bacterium]|nr:hypothetical protein [Planctomycetaceae bacterium]
MDSPPPEATLEAAAAEQSVAVRVFALVMARVGMIGSIGSSFAVFGLQALHSILLARLLGPVGRGEYGTAMLFTQTMLFVGLAGTLYSIARRAMESSEAGSDENIPLRRAAVRVGAITGLSSMAVAMCLSYAAVPSDKRHVLILCFVCSMMLPLEHMRLTLLAVDHGKGDFRRYNIARVFAAAVFPVIVLFLFLNQWDSLPLIAGLTVLVPVIGLVQYAAMTGYWNPFGPASPTSARLIREGAGDGLAVLAGDMFDRLGHILLLWMVSMKDYGFYITALPAASLLLVGPHTFALYSFRSGSAGEGLTRRQVAGRMVVILVFQTAALAALWFVIEPLLDLLFQDEFDGIVPVAKVLLFAMAAHGCGLVGDGFLRGCGKGSYGVLTRIVAAVVMLVSAFSLPIGESLIRISMAMAIGYAAGALLTAFLCLRFAVESGTPNQEMPSSDEDRLAVIES